MRIGSLCSGYGGLDGAVAEVFGAETAWFCEYDADPSRILAHHWPHIPNHGDVTTLDWAAVEPVDLLIGGIPCQPFSDAGKRLATGDPRHLWPYMADGVRALRPRHVIVENVSGFIVRGGLDCVLGDLAALGYDAAWASVRASDAGAPHRRERVFLVATDTAGTRRGEGRSESAGRLGRPATVVGGASAPDADGQGSQGRESAQRRDLSTRCGYSPTPNADRIGLHGFAQLDAPAPTGIDGAHRGHADGRGDGPDWGAYTPAIRRWEHVLGRRAPRPTEPGRSGERLSPRFVEWLMGLPEGHVTDVPGLSRNAQLKALGNGVVPQQAALALRLLTAQERAA